MSSFFFLFFHVSSFIYQPNWIQTIKPNLTKPNQAQLNLKETLCNLKDFEISKSPVRTHTCSSMAAVSALTARASEDLHPTAGKPARTGQPAKTKNKYKVFLNSIFVLKKAKLLHCQSLFWIKLYFWAIYSQGEWYNFLFISGI